MKLLHFFPLAAGLAIVSAQANPVRPVDKVKTQVMVARSAVGFKECGIRFIYSEDKGNETTFYDLQIVAVADTATGGMITGTRAKMTTEQLMGLRGAPPTTPGPSPVQFWIAKNTDAKPLVPIKIVDDKEEKGYLVAFTRFEPTVQQIRNMAQGSPMHIMLQYPDEPERVVEVTAPLEHNDMQTLSACLQDMMKRSGSMPELRPR